MDSLQKNYIQEVLGVQHLWMNKIESQSSYEKKVLGLPTGLEPKLIFLSLDSQDHDWSDQHEVVFQNIIKALKLQAHQIWKSPVIEITILDFLTHLRHRDWNSSVVVMSRHPHVSELVNRMGTHLWVEIFSISEMIKRPEVKKISWQLLQELMKNL
ncbi:MAG: hypothetical protein ACK5V3_14650 [Bdellovibrionales bacterium]